MPGDNSPLSGSGLESPARSAGPAGGTTPARPKAAAQPSLARVAGTTLHLWLRRRVLRVPDGSRVSPARWAVLAVAVLVVAGAAAGLTVGLAGSRAAAVARHHLAGPKPDPARTQLIATEQAAAAWIATQVETGTAVTCDSAMCGYLASAGLPAAQLTALAPGASLPAAAGLVVATATVRGQTGAQLTGRAPEVIAAFGTGPDAIQVRVLTGGTPSAFLATARQEVAASAAAGRQLIHRGLHVGGAAERELLAGRVDARLLVVLSRLLAAHPVYVAGFGDGGPGASWPTPLRSVTIDRLVSGRGKHRVSDLTAVLKLLGGQPAPYRAKVTQVQLSGSRTGVLVQFPAPGSP